MSGSDADVSPGAHKQNRTRRNAIGRERLRPTHVCHSRALDFRPPDRHSDGEVWGDALVSSALMLAQMGDSNLSALGERERCELLHAQTGHHTALIAAKTNRREHYREQLSKHLGEQTSGKRIGVLCRTACRPAAGLCRADPARSRSADPSRGTTAARPKDLCPSARIRLRGARAAAWCGRRRC